MRNRCVLTVALFAATLAAAGQPRPAWALINPKFTPVQLVQQSDTIAVLKLAAPDAKQVVVAEVRKSLKGKAAGGSPAKDRLTIDLSTAGQKEHAKAVGEAIARMGDQPALLFVGKNENQEDATFLAISGQWIRLEQRPDGSLAMAGVDVTMQGTWAGAADMLLKVVEYILSDESAEVPSGVGFSWADRLTLGKIDGKVFGMQAVDLAGKGEFSLFIGADRGDRMYRFDSAANQFKDVTAAVKLSGKSQLAAWADFNGDGRLDLASWDGKQLTLSLQSADGAFAAPVPFADELKGCLGLTVIDVGVAKRPGLLVCTSEGPVVLVPSKDGGFDNKPVPLARGSAGKDFKSSKMIPGACVAADLDGDGKFDVLEIFPTGSLFYKRKGGGSFAEAVKCPVAAGKGRTIAFTGDYDGEGRLDLFTCSDDGCRLWVNRGPAAGGGVTFEDAFDLSGELSYTAGPGAIGGATCDINNDGRQDVFLVYPDGIPMIFFNRGFRSFGKALELTERGSIPETAKGLQAGTVEDLNGDGAQDLAVVLKDGTVMVFLRKVYEGESPLVVRAALPLDAAFAGPINITAWADKRPLGAWSVTAGSADAFLARPSAGQVTLKWQLPGGKPVEKKVSLIDKAARVVITP